MNKKSKGTKRFRSARAAGRLILVFALLSQSFLFSAEFAEAQRRKPRRNRKGHEATARKRTPNIALPGPIIVNQNPATPGPVSEPSAQQKIKPAKPLLKPIQKQPRVDAKVIQQIRIEPVSTSIVSFQELALKDQLRPKASGPTTGTAIHPPLTIDDSAAAQVTPKAATAQGQSEVGGPMIPSPSASQTFLAQEDGPKVGTTSFTIPPDTNGAVGIDKVFTNTNSNYRIHDKTTGAALSTVNIDTFWTSSGGTGFFDPQIQFDPYNQRWILAVASNFGTANSSIEVAVSQTSDPQGSYFVFRFIVGCANGAMGCASGGEFADFPMLGFNKNWVVVAANMFNLNSTTNNNSKTLVLDYPALRTGTANATIFSDPDIGFCAYPATTLDPAQSTLFVPTHISSFDASYKLDTITGTAAAPIYAVGTTKTRPGGGWTQPSGDNLPQQCIAGVAQPGHLCPATIRKIDTGDAQIRSGPVFRNNRIWYAQTIALPLGVINNNSRFVAQWTALDTAGDFADGGRVEDATATLTNGGKHYAYPSLTVNKNDDVLLGFSEFESDDYADAGYTFRAGTDTAGTMRDPVIYKEGEDYYQKTFSGTRNRWGDYSHTLVDPANDRDLWTVQEYAQLRTGATGTGTNDSRWGTFWAKVVAPAINGDLLISEFRLRGPGGATDEFIEIYNPTSLALTVAAIDGSAGYSMAASDGLIRCTIPNGTVIPSRGHFLCVNSGAYSLGNYPAGSGTTATGDATYTTDVPDNAGIALFNTATPANFATATRLDAVGSTLEANALYKEGTGYPPLSGSFYTAGIDYSFYRDTCGKGGSITADGVCPTSGFPKDTNINAADFVFVDTSGANAGAGQRIGAPGPENLSSPIQRNSQFGVFMLDATMGSASPPNRVRDFTADLGNNSPFGTLDVRRRFVNSTGGPVTRLRFRIVDVTTFSAPSGFADLRARTSSSILISGINDPATCPGGTTPCNVTVEGTAVDQPPSQTSGGGFNTSLSAGTITLAAPLAPGASVNLRFLLGIQQAGTFRFFINVEALP